MKKLLFGMFAAAGMLMAASCQNEGLDTVQAGDEVAVSFTFEQPGIATRAYSDGTTATTLTYAAYEQTSGKMVAHEEVAAAFVGKQATVTLNLKRGVTYDVVFWADAEGAPYTFSTADKTISVDYTSVVCTDEKLDAFFAAKEVCITEAATVPVVLTRPFAQLNIGTSGVTNAELPAQTSVTVPVYSTLNLLSGKVEGEAKAETYKMNNIPGPNDRFPIAGIKYLAMNYLLVADEKVNVDVTFATSDGYTVNYNNIPVQRNYRTNIYGNLLKADAEFQISIDETINDWPDTPTTAITYVDLGTGVLWANMNIGAGTPEDLGGYFAWGEVSSVNESYGWNFYDFYTGDPYHEGDKSEFMSVYNATDGLTVLGADHDAAAKNWADGSRIPTKEEFEKLISDCTWVWDAAKNGWNISGTNGNSIFLPGAPYKDGNHTYGKETEDCMYWTATLGENVTTAYYLECQKHAAPTKDNLVTYYRRIGLQIRPVKSVN